MKTTEKSPLVEALVKHRRRKNVSFHMPGHKSGKGLQRRFKRLIIEDPFGFDLTELPGLDDLHRPTGPIETAQLRAARLFGADYTFFLVNGTTSGIHASVLSACRSGEEILIPRESHRSIIGACILAGLRPRYLPAELDGEFFIPCPAKAWEVALALEKYPAVKAVFQTYPSFYGLAGDLPEIVKLAHAHNIPLIADEAHGAHFRFSDCLPGTAMEAEADLSVQSTHKTLGSFTQSSMLHVRSRLVSHEEVSRQLAILQSTSPSYLLLASLDAAVAHMESGGEELVRRAVKIANRVREQINGIPGLKCLGEEIVSSGRAVSLDPAKLLISVSGLGLSGHRVAEILRKKYRIQAELSDRFNILCIFTFGNTVNDGFRLVNALRLIAAGRKQRRSINILDGLKYLPLPPVRVNPREAWYSLRRMIPLEESCGEISAEMVAPYPPGVPLICPGEEITGEIIEMIQRLKAGCCSFHGPADPALKHVAVMDMSG